VAEHEKPWIGVDLDGTLAHDYGWRGASHIGSPIKRMVDRVRRWHNAGKCVKIFTARASKPECIHPIKAWLKKHRLPDLEITNVKTPGMVQMWDDRAVPMRRNRGTRRDDGRIAESVVSTLLGEDDEYYREFPDFHPYWVNQDGEIFHAWPGGHIEWGRRRLGLDPEFTGVMAEMQRRGWLRMVVRGNEVLIDTYKASPAQRQSVRDWAIERRKLVFDEKTQRQYED